MSRVRARRTRARLAVAACALWLVGVEGMPALHEALHARLAPHRHDAGALITVSFEDTTHRHPDGTLHVVVARPHAPAAQRATHDDRPCVSDATGHTADGLAHHAAALAPAPPPITEPLPVDRRPTSLIIDRCLELVARDPLAATARGPPVLA